MGKDEREERKERRKDDLAAVSLSFVYSLPVSLLSFHALLDDTRERGRRQRRRDAGQ